MKFSETPLHGAFVVEIEPRLDERGFFARAWCEREFREHGLNPALSQCNVSWNTKAGTLHGMHYQEAPYAEAKLVRCTRGAMFDAIVDLRLDSPTYTRWYGLELSADNRRMIYVPEGFAHGYQTLVDDTELYYQVSVPYQPNAARGVRWDDPAFGIQWPEASGRTMAERDRTYPDFQP